MSLEAIRNLDILLKRIGACFIVPAIVGTAGCHAFSAETPGPVSIRSAQDTAWLIAKRGGISFDVPILVRNRSPQVLHVGWCGIKAERLIVGKWETVFTPVCFVSNNVSAIQPGDSVLLDFFAYGLAAPNAVPPLNPRMTVGLYRAVVPIWSEDTDGNRLALPAVQRTSSTFIVARGPDSLSANLFHIGNGNRPCRHYGPSESAGATAFPPRNDSVTNIACVARPCGQQ